MKYLSLDIGEKRTGVAVSDELGITTRPVTTLQVDESFLENLGKIIKTEFPAEIIIGVPRHQNGKESEKINQIKEFAKVIHHEYNLPVDFEDESATSIEAERRLKEKGLTVSEIKECVDSEAAAIILESYLRRK